MPKKCPFIIVKLVLVAVEGRTGAQDQPCPKKVKTIQFAAQSTVKSSPLPKGLIASKNSAILNIADSPVIVYKTRVHKLPPTHCHFIMKNWQVNLWILWSIYYKLKELQVNLYPIWGIWKLLFFSPKTLLEPSSKYKL